MSATAYRSVCLLPWHRRSLLAAALFANRELESAIAASMWNSSLPVGVLVSMAWSRPAVPRFYATASPRSAKMAHRSCEAVQARTDEGVTRSHELQCRRQFWPIRFRPTELVIEDLLTITQALQLRVNVLIGAGDPAIAPRINFPPAVLQVDLRRIVQIGGTVAALRVSPLPTRTQLQAQV